MPETKAKPAARKTTVKPRPTAVKPSTPKVADKDTKATLTRTFDRAAELSTDVLTSVEAGSHAALAAVRKFADTVDETLPALGERPTRREAVIDAALDMADKLVTTQYEFIRSVVRSADRSLHDGEASKK